MACLTGWSRTRLRLERAAVFGTHVNRDYVSVMVVSRPATRSVPVPVLRLLRAGMTVMQEFGKLFAQAFVAFAAVADHDRVLEQLFLNRRRQLCPKVKRRGAQQGCKTVVLFGHA